MPKESRTWDRAAYEVVENIVEVGVRVSYLQLREKTQGYFDEDGKFAGGFLGSINRLSEEQTIEPSLFANVVLNDYCGLEMSWLRLGGVTSTYKDGHSDGTFHLIGPTAVFWLRYPTEMTIRPRIGVGVAWLRTDFEEDPAWRMGLSRKNYEAWLAEGSPGMPYPNYGFVQVIDTENVAGLILQAGLDAELRRQLFLEFDLRYVMAEVNGHYYMSQYGTVVDDRGITTFPMDALYVALGLRYDF